MREEYLEGARRATKANSSGLPRGTEGVNVGGRACVLVHVERAERESGLMADIWHQVAPVWFAPAPRHVTPNDRAQISPQKVGTLRRSKATPPQASPPPTQWCRQEAPSPINVPICFPKCSQEEFITVFFFCGGSGGQKLIKDSFLLNSVNWPRGWSDAEWRREFGGRSTWQFTDVYCAR